MRIMSIVAAAGLFWTSGAYAASEIPTGYYTYFACEKRAWDLKYKGILLWADRNSIPAFCRNSEGGKYPVEAKKNLR
jgi:hypothetical protein